MVYYQEILRRSYGKKASALSMVKALFTGNTLHCSSIASSASNDKLDIPFSNNADAWNDFVTKINKSLDKLDIEFRLFHDESSGREMYALVRSRFMGLKIYSISSG